MRKRILLVEDNALVLESMRIMLEKLGYVVLTAQDGKEGWHLFQKNQEEIGMLIVDAVLPKMSGAELAQCVKEACPKIKVVFLSGCGQQKWLGVPENLIDGWLNKPVLLEDLKEFLETLFPPV